MAARLSLKGRRVGAAWCYLTPLLLVLGAVAGWPLARSVWLSMTDAVLGAGATSTFVGFDNYLVHRDGAWEGVLADSMWWRAVGNTLYFTVVSVSLETLLGLVIALMLNASLPLRGLLRIAVLIPWAIPAVVSAQMWGWMLHDQYGVVNEILLLLGIIEAPLAWTADEELAMWSVILADVWKTTPFMALLLFAALRMLPRDCFEAARVDGIHPFRVFVHVTLPLIARPLLIAVLFRTLDALRVFDVIYVMTATTPHTMSMSLYARQQIVEFQDVGAGSAASTLLFFSVALLTILLLGMTRFRRDAGERR